jgi:hypothetical protein
MPDTPETVRRRQLARRVITSYLLIGVAAFTIAASAVGGTETLRARVGALAALGAVGAAWLVTHTILTRRHPHGDNDHDGPNAKRRSVRARHIVEWIVGLAAVAAALGVAWHLQNLTTAHPMSWASSFVTATIFVLVSLGTVSATLHHHSYVHHGHHHSNLG